MKVNPKYLLMSDAVCAKATNESVAFPMKRENRKKKTTTTKQTCASIFPDYFIEEIYNL